MCWIWKTHWHEHTKLTDFWRKLYWIDCYSNTDSAVPKLLTARTLCCAGSGMTGWSKALLGLSPTSLGIQPSTRHLLAIPVTSGATDACKPEWRKRQRPKKRCRDPVFSKVMDKDPSKPLKILGFRPKVMESNPPKLNNSPEKDYSSPWMRDATRPRQTYK